MPKREIDGLLADFVKKNYPDPAIVTNLNLSEFKDSISIPNFQTIKTSEFAKMLETFQNVEELDLSGHDEIENIEMSLIRNTLPKLKKLILKNITPEISNISTEQYCKFFAKNIWIVADSEYAMSISRNAIFYLEGYGQADYAKLIREEYALSKGEQALTQENLNPEKFRLALLQAEQAKQKQASEQKEIESMQHTFQHNIKNTLLSDYAKGTNFDKNDKWFSQGPKNPSDFNNQEMFQEPLFLLYLAITEKKLWPIVSEYKGRKSFLDKTPDPLDQLYNHPAILSLNLSGQGLHLSMCLMRNIAKQGGFQEFCKNKVPSTRNNVHN